ncbi:hypothetical protein HYH03_001124 [Edaphochlamys debaryana]|uniref:Uncharacterized protein n=1 Tax=Edaphochlamys debaryana TaxID=47281 RepID=A0A835YEQ9_9CHLO|nr:hypothetical protein HYH03_001124 [Edaphochlamys debaryana]|eukprot:KAG2501333.1 hypothetical protein HYH03_001124 [Edaphochlamys debaryana]
MRAQRRLQELRGGASLSRKPRGPATPPPPDDVPIEAETSWASLSAEALSMVGARLGGLRDRVAAALVCRHWREQLTRGASHAHLELADSDGSAGSVEAAVGVLHSGRVLMPQVRCVDVSVPWRYRDPDPLLRQVHALSRWTQLQSLGMAWDIPAAEAAAAETATTAAAVAYNLTEHRSLTVSDSLRAHAFYPYDGRQPAVLSALCLGALGRLTGLRRLSLAVRLTSGHNTAKEVFGPRGVGAGLYALSTLTRLTELELLQPPPAARGIEPMNRPVAASRASSSLTSARPSTTGSTLTTNLRTILFGTNRQMRCGRNKPSALRPPTVFASLAVAAADSYPGSNSIVLVRTPPPDCRNGSVAADGSVVPIPQRCWTYTATVVSVQVQATDVDSSRRSLYANYDFELENVTGLCVTAVREECFARRQGPEACLALGFAAYRAQPDWFDQFAREVDASPQRSPTPPPQATLPSADAQQQSPAGSSAPLNQAAAAVSVGSESGGKTDGSGAAGGGGGSAEVSLAWVAAPVAVGVAVVGLAIAGLLWRRRRQQAERAVATGAGSVGAPAAREVHPADCERAEGPSSDSRPPDISSCPLPVLPPIKGHPPLAAADTKHPGGATTPGGTPKSSSGSSDAQTGSLPSSVLSVPTAVPVRPPEGVLNHNHISSACSRLMW